MKRIATFILFIVTSITLSAQTDLSVSKLRIPTKISTAYFAPNAFPVPEMLDGRTSDKWKVEVYGDYFIRTIGRASASDADYTDRTSDLSFKITIPLFTPRVNLVAWGPIFEAYNSSHEVCQLRRIKYDGDLKGMCTGDIYLSTDIMVLTQEKAWVDVTLRSALKTASGDRFEYARYYDNAGYFFDLTAGRGFYSASRRTEFHIAATAGFLCWPTDKGRQNDAVMYGVLAALNSGPFSLSAEYGGYVGWEGDGDRPMTVKVKTSYTFKGVGFNLGYQRGLIDWPFHQFRFGLSYTFR